ncbi:MAG: VOC family protein [Vampirovibrionia bacterium]
MKIEHIALWVKDLEKMTNFYVSYFAGVTNDKYVNEAKGFESYFISFESGSRLELMSKISIKESFKNIDDEYFGYAHMAFRLGSKEKVDKLTEQFKQDGYKIAGYPRTTGDGYYESCILDPEGNRVELME